MSIVDYNKIALLQETLTLTKGMIMKRVLSISILLSLFLVFAQAAVLRVTDVLHWPALSNPVGAASHVDYS